MPPSQVRPASALRWTQWSRSCTVDTASIRPWRNAQSGLTTETVWESRPINDKRLRFLPEPQTWGEGSDCFIWLLVCKKACPAASGPVERQSLVLHPRMWLMLMGLLSFLAQQETPVSRRGKGWVLGCFGTLAYQVGLAAESRHKYLHSFLHETASHSPAECLCQHMSRARNTCISVNTNAISLL